MLANKSGCGKAKKISACFARIPNAKPPPPPQTKKLSTIMQWKVINHSNHCTNNCSHYIEKFMVCSSIDVKREQSINFLPTANGLSALVMYHVASSLFARSFGSKVLKNGYAWSSRNPVEKQSRDFYLVFQI